MLGVVSIIVILCGLSVPGIDGIKTKLDMMRLNGIAEEIYTSVQNKTIHLRALDDKTFETSFCNKSRESSDPRMIKTVFNNTPPQDYPKDEGGQPVDSEWQNLYYLSSKEDSNFVQFLLPTSGIGALGGINGDFIIEMNPNTGDVYSVFYTEECENLRERYLSNDRGLYSSRDEDTRVIDRVGYYSGNALSMNMETIYPTIEVINGEDLLVKVHCDDILSYAMQGKLDISVALSYMDETTHKTVDFCSFSGNGAPGNVTDNMSVEVSGTGIDATFLLDSSKVGKSYIENVTNSRNGEGKEELLDAALLTGGKDIIATGVMVYHGKTLQLSGWADSGTFNTYFKSVSERNADEDNTVNDVRIGAVRHLRNLNNVQPDAFTQEKILVYQEKELDFDPSTWDTAELFRGSTSGTQTYFEPINNPFLFGSDSNTGAASYDGLGHPLIHFVIQNSSDKSGPVGLFSGTNCLLQNVRLQYPKVDGGNATSVGTLVGRMYGGEIKGCGSYLDDINTCENNESDPIIKNYMNEDKVVASGSTNVGGLVGLAGSGNIVDSWGAVKVDTNGCTNDGGLVGRAVGTHIKHCYSSCAVQGASNVGGLVGNGSPYVNECYSTSKITGTTTTAGILAGKSGKDKRVKDCTFYGNVANRRGDCGAIVTWGKVGTDCKYLQMYNHNGLMSDKQKHGAIPAAYMELTTDESPRAYAYSYDLVTEAFPFQLITTDDDVVINHYGDWPESRPYVSVVYYEKYAKSSNPADSTEYGFYVEGVNSEEEFGIGINTLKEQPQLDKEKLTVVEDGYAIMSSERANKFECKLNDRDDAVYTSSKYTFEKIVGPNKDAEDPNKDGTFRFKGDNSYYHIYKMPFELQDTPRDAQDTFYDKLNVTANLVDDNGEKVVIGDSTHYYNPHMAKTAVQKYDEEGTAPSNPKRTYIRTARQFNNIGRYSYYWNVHYGPEIDNDRMTYKQELDINFSTYEQEYCGVDIDLMDVRTTNPYRNRPIGTASILEKRGANYLQNEHNAFECDYDGGNFEIINARIFVDSSTIASETLDNNREITMQFPFAGLFGEVCGGSIRNVHLVSEAPENYDVGILKKDPTAPEERNYGFVYSTYNLVQDDQLLLKIAGERTITLSPAVGSLVGMAYSNTSMENKSMITNCSQSGYFVVYKPEATAGRGTGTKNENPKENVAVGGLIGTNLANISCCSASSAYVQLNDNNNSTTLLTDRHLSVGGFIGSAVAGKVENSFSEGLVHLYIDGTALEAPITSVIGGFAGSGVSCTLDNPNNDPLSIANCYTTCKVDDSARTINFSSIQQGLYNQHSIYTVFSELKNLTNCYYIDNLSGRISGIDTTHANGYATEKTIATLPEAEFGSEWEVPATGKTYHAWSDMCLNQADCPYPSPVADRNGDIAHWGDWYVGETEDRVRVDFGIFRVVRENGEVTDVQFQYYVEGQDSMILSKYDSGCDYSREDAIAVAPKSDGTYYVFAMNNATRNIALVYPLHWRYSINGSSTTQHITLADEPGLRHSIGLINTDSLSSIQVQAYHNFITDIVDLTVGAKLCDWATAHEQLEFTGQIGVITAEKSTDEDEGDQYQYDYSYYSCTDGKTVTVEYSELPEFESLRPVWDESDTKRYYAFYISGKEGESVDWQRYIIDGVAYSINSLKSGTYQQIIGAESTAKVGFRGILYDESVIYNSGCRIQ